MKSLGILREEVLTFFCVNCWRKFQDGTSGLFVDFSCLVTIEIHLITASQNPSKMPIR